MIYLSPSKIKNVVLFIVIFGIMAGIFSLKKFNTNDVSLDMIETEGVPKLEVGVSVMPLMDVVKRVGGGRVNVHLLTAEDVERIAVLKNPPAPFFVLSAEESSARIYRERVDAGAVIALDALMEEGGGFGFYWLSLRNAQRITQEVARALGEKEQVSSEYFLSNSYEYVIELMEAQKQFLEGLAPYTTTAIAVVDNSFDVYAQEFQLNVVGHFNVPTTGEEGFITSLIKTIKEKKIRALLVGTDFPQAALEAVRSQTRARIAILDPYGYLRDSYLDLMRYNVSETLKALR